MIEKEVKTLLELKAEYKKATGEDWKPDAAPAVASASAPVPQTISQVGPNWNLKLLKSFFNS